MPARERSAGSPGRTAGSPAPPGSAAPGRAGGRRPPCTADTSGYASARGNPARPQTNGTPPIYQKPPSRNQSDSSGVQRLLRLRQELAQEVQAGILFEGHLARHLALDVELEQRLAVGETRPGVVGHLPAVAVVPAPEN